MTDETRSRDNQLKSGTICVVPKEFAEDQESHLIYADQRGRLREVSAKAIRAVPSEFKEILAMLSHDMQLALDCIDLFDGIPLVVAQAILRNMEPAHAAIDMAVRCSPKVEVVN